MKKEWKVYIKGVEGRGKEVIKILTDLGAKNDGAGGDNPNCIYFIGHDGTIDIGWNDSEFGQIIMNNYKEIKLFKQWNDGDILIRKDNDRIFCVYQKPADNGKGFLCHVYVSKDTLFTEVTVPTDPADNYRKATDAEKSTFYSLISNHHLCWDAENKQLIDWRQKGKEELYEQWNNGDILISKDKIKYIVFRKYSYNTMFYTYDFSISIDKDNNIWYKIAGKEDLYKTEDFRLATSEEIKQFYALLHNVHKDWDSERKHLVNLKLKPTLYILLDN